jgi:hypothetical protein
MPEPNAKSVIEIDVNDAAWKEFEAAFGAYNAAVDESKKKLDDMGEAAQGAAGKAGKSFDKLKTLLSDLGKMGRDSVHIFTRMATLAWDIAKAFASAAWSAAKWLAFGAIASGFGLGALASSASATRREAGGAGVKPGEYKAADIYFKQILGDSAGVLSNVAQTMNDPAARIAFTSLGIDPRGKNPFQLMNEFLVAASAKARANPNIPLPVFQSTIGKILSLEQYKALGATQPGEVAGLSREAMRSAPGLSLSDKTLSAWQRFLIMLDLAGNRIENSLIAALVKLAGPLGTFANQIADAVNAFSKSGGFQRMLDNLIEGIKKFGAYITSPDFPKDMDTFMNALADIADALVKVAAIVRKAYGLPSAYMDLLAKMNATGGEAIQSLVNTVMGRDDQGGKTYGSPEEWAARKALRDKLEMRGQDALASGRGQGGAVTRDEIHALVAKNMAPFPESVVKLVVTAPPYLDFSASMAQGAGQ